MRYLLVMTLVLTMGIFACQKDKPPKRPVMEPVTIATDTTDTGLMIQEIKTGDGAEAQVGNTVEVHYSGWFTDGKLFDSSLLRKKPLSLELGAGSVIAGWEEGIQGMKVGGKRRLTIPPHLGYGAKGYPGAIPPNSTLVFDVELVSVK